MPESVTTKYVFGLPVWVWPIPLGWCALNLAVGQWWVILGFIPVLGFCIWKGESS